MKEKTFIYRHRRENLKKCSLHGLEARADLQFFTYPKHTLPPLFNTLILTLNSPPLTPEDRGRNLLIIDGTWRLAGKMMQSLEGEVNPALFRSIPPKICTAYPRRQDDCPDQQAGLASVEALFVAHHILGLKTEGLLDHYHWKDLFLQKNRDYL